MRPSPTATAIRRWTAGTLATALIASVGVAASLNLIEVSSASAAASTQTGSGDPGYAAAGSGPISGVGDSSAGAESYGSSSPVTGADGSPHSSTSGS